MNEQTALTRFGLGAAAGLAGTTAIAGLRTATKRWLPELALEPRQDVGEYLVAKAEAALPRKTRKRVPETLERVAASSIHLGVGTTPAALFAALRPHARHPLAEGAALGLALWAAGYLGVLPALGLTPPVRRQRRAQVLTSLLQHALYGMVTVGAYRRLQEAAARDG